MNPLFVPVPIPVTSRRSVVPVYHQYYQYQPMQAPVIIGNLPDDFLRLPTSPAQTQEERDRAAAIHLQNSYIAQARQPINVGRYEISVINAVLNKNYGISRMDPYVRLRIGHRVYETHTVVNGSKNPHWNKTFQIYNLPPEINSIYVEIFDERTLTVDELIAWAHITIPEAVRKGEVLDEWIKLSGKLGEQLEGVLHLTMTYTTQPAPIPPSVMMLPGYAGSVYPHVPVYTLPPAAPSYAIQTTYPPSVGQPYPAPVGGTPVAVPPPVISQSDIKQLNEMFPGIESQVVQSVLEASNGNKEVAINSLLQMQ